MEEVDQIITHSLRGIGCHLDADCSMAHFTPNLLVHVVSSCLQEIRPHCSLPRLLPEGMAQRFAVSTKLAEMCANCGYRGDIGYQTFLYPNAVDVRRLLMFLVEQLPKDNHGLEAQRRDDFEIGEYEILHKEISDKISKQLHGAWVPQYCRGVGNWRHSGCSSQTIAFVPQTNLHIAGGRSLTKEAHQYLEQQAPSVFQQTAAKGFDLISSVLNKNAFDLYADTSEADQRKFSLSGICCVEDSGTGRSISPSTKVKETADDKAANATMPLTPLEKLSEQVNALKCQNDKTLAERKSIAAEISTCRSKEADVHADREEMRQQVRMHERTCVVLEDPEENLKKLEGLIQSAVERKKTLNQQWQEYRAPMMMNLQSLKAAKQTRNIQDVMDLREVIKQLEQGVREKTTQHGKLSVELKNVANSEVAPRKEYIRRIFEFIANIRKQQNDIFKVLDDTRDLQKQLNSVSAQLQRQFNYTDDLLFQSAKHDLHAKKAYKLLASLHATCNELVELVSQTGNITKCIRELEVQIDCEKLKNIALSLEQISTDITKFEGIIKSIQSDIYKVENQITVA